MTASETNIHDVHGIYWDRSEECLHLHIVSERGIFNFNLFHADQPEVTQATVPGEHHPAGRLAKAAAEKLKD